MNTNIQTKTFKELPSLKIKESNEIFNRNSKGSVSALMKSKREISRQTNNSIKQSGLTYPLPNPKNTRPPLTKEEINQLARAWCELLLGQIQEAHNQQQLTRAI